MTNRYVVKIPIVIPNQKDGSQFAVRTIVPNYAGADYSPWVVAHENQNALGPHLDKLIKKFMSELDLEYGSEMEQLMVALQEYGYVILPCPFPQLVVEVKDGH